MVIKLVADLHGRFDDLAGAISKDDILLILGDMLDLLDWADFSGILPDVLGRDKLASRMMAAVTAGPGKALELRDELLAPEGPYYPQLFRRVSDSYHELIRALQRISCRSYVLYGNSDIPALLEASLDGMDNTGGIVLAEGKMDIEGTTFGFVPGALYSPFMMPAEMDEEAYGERLERLGPVDVLCTHIPPRLESVTMDVVAGRPVEGSTRLLEYIEENKPRILYHGHVHQPAQREVMIGETRVINVAYYKRTGYVHVHGA
jgi:Icc-related predicted phosphoesterase